MTGIILDSVLMLLLVAALGYGVRLERKLAALRAGQLAFASAVTELNTAASRAEAALASLRSSGQETDLLHDRIVKGRALKAELEGVINRGRGLAPDAGVAPSVSLHAQRSTSPSPRDGEETPISSLLRSNGEVARRDSAVTEGATLPAVAAGAWR